METDLLRIRKFTHVGLFQTKENLNINENTGGFQLSERDLVELKNNIKESISKNISAKNKESENSRLKALFLPNGNFRIIQSLLIKAYSLLNSANNLENIKRVFLIGQASLATKSTFNISGYSYYKTIFDKQYAIDHLIYDEILINGELKKYIDKFEIQQNSFTTFYEENGSLKEKKQDITYSIEDQEFSFDIHLAMLNIIFDNDIDKFRIVPIWLNEVSSEALSLISIMLGSYFNKDENLFIFSSNLTHFGRYYNFYVDEKKFKSRSFLKDNNNESIVRDYLTKMDSDVVIDSIRNIKSNDKIQKLYPYCKNLINLLINLLIESKSKLLSEKIEYTIESLHTTDSEYEMNLITYLSIVIYINSY